MSRPADYTFLPWLRQGIASQIGSGHGDVAIKERATVKVELEVAGDPVAGAAAPLPRPVDRDVALYGPGDIVGIDQRAIVRTEPRDRVTNFEPNYLAQIEFYDEDFPWRYTPSAPDASRQQLRPWIMLVVLEEGTEFVDAGHAPGRPLAAIDVKQPSALPPLAGLWAWAHVHVNRSLTASDAELVATDPAAVLGRLDATLAENRDLGFARIVCPRLLRERANYHAFLVPTFETGRLAGLGFSPALAPHATWSAWEPYPKQESPGRLPVYHRWSFSTGTLGDFEQLVRLLKPEPVDPRVGRRPIDVRRPGSGIPGIDDERLRGALELGGALRVPRIALEDALDDDELQVVKARETWATPYPHEFQRGLAGLINLADDYAAKPPEVANPAAAANGLGPQVTGDPDPLVTAPLYAQWHALTRRLLTERNGAPDAHADDWVHELNLDPRHRVAAGFGTRVIQGRQEEYMAAAWEQVGDVLEANRRIREAQLGLQAAASMYGRHVEPLVGPEPGRALALTAPVQRHVVDGGVTVHHRRTESLVPPALTSTVMRRLTRPGSRLMTALPFDATTRPQDLAEAVDSGHASAAPAKQTPPGIVTTDDVADLLLPAGVPPWLVGLLRGHRWLVWLVLLLALLVCALVVTGILPVWWLIVAVVLLLLWWLLRRWAKAIADSDVIRPGQLKPGAVGKLPGGPSPIKDALDDWAQQHAGSSAAAAQPTPGPLGVAGAAQATVSAINPDVTIPDRTGTTVQVPDRIADELGGGLVEAMAYPRIDVPMYKPLTDSSKERFLPNLGLIARNSITLVETNQDFIESYMVGLNHEFGRELLWREFPTDQRGSCFRQFWDVRGVLDGGPADPEARRERLYDIPKLHAWRRGSHLGQHDHRAPPGQDREEAVLVIRGELLQKYPNAVIYVQRAKWQKTAGHIDPSKERTLVRLTDAEEDRPPHDKLRMPLYEARVEPDITFLGFDLSVPDARGGPGTHPNDPAGWFFVIKERPGEPRFGLDIKRDGPIQTVNDLAWNDAGAAGGLLPAGAFAPLTLAPLTDDDDEKKVQRDDDVKVVGTPASSARWAYILYQAPVIVAVHAADLLPPPR